MNITRLVPSLCLAIGLAPVGLFAQIPSFAAADLVLGQPDFTTNNVGSPTATKLIDPRDIAIDPTTGKVFVSDGAANRVLRYATEAALTNGAAAEAVFGQPDFTSDAINAGGGLIPSQNSLFVPIGIFVDGGGRLWVADASNNRVLMFSNASTRSNFAPADKVLGQAGYTTRADGVSSVGMRVPWDVWVDDEGNLAVSNGATTSSVTLFFEDAANKLNGGSADKVFGTGDFMGNTDPGPNARDTINPRGISIDSTGTLRITDSDQNRVMAYSNVTTVSSPPGPNAFQVIGQSNFTSGGSATTQSGLDLPTAAQVDPFGDLWVMDSSNNRILRYSGSASLANGADAVAVLGQQAFTTNSSQRSTTKMNLSSLSLLFVDAQGDVWVADTNNNRVLRFSRPAAIPAPVVDTTAPDLRIRGRKTVETLRNRVVIRGRTSDASGVREVDVKARGAKVAKSKVKANGTFKVVLRVTKDRGRLVAKLRAIDNVGNRSKVSRFRILRR